MDIVSALRAFLRVAETGSFSAAALDLNLTQPAVSRQVSALEEHLNTRLLHRTTSALALTAKRGRVVVTNIHPAAEVPANVSLLDLTLMEKQVVGSLFGSANPRADIPKLLELWRDGQIDLDGLVTKTYNLDGVNDGYDDMRAGNNIRGVMVYE